MRKSVSEPVHTRFGVVSLNIALMKSVLHFTHQQSV